MAFFDRLTSVSPNNPFMPSRMDDPMDMLDQFIKRLPREDTIPPMTRGNIGRIGQMMQPQQPQHSTGIPLDAASEGMNVVYQPSISEKIGQERIADIVHPDPERKMRQMLLESNLGMKKAELGVKQQRANVYQFKAENPGAKYIQGKDGVLRAFDPVSHELLSSWDTGMSDEEVINLNQKGRMELEGKKGEEARTTEETRQKGRESIEDIKARHAKELAEYESGLPGKGNQLATQETRKFQNNYNRFINANPELRGFVRLDANGMPIITPVGSTWKASNSPTQEQYDKINQAIFGSSKNQETVTKPTENETKKEESKKEEPSKKSSKFEVISVKPSK